MIEVKVVGVAIDTSNQHVVLLGKKDTPDEGPLMPIWIGAGEASSILIGSGQMNSPRPLTHDLLQSILDSLEAEITSIEITNIDNGTYLAVIYIESSEREHIVDARPSDAIALAVRANAPIYIGESLFEESSITELFDAESDAEQQNKTQSPHPSGISSAADLKDYQVFKKFLEDLKPEDFITDSSGDEPASSAEDPTTDAKEQNSVHEDPDASHEDPTSSNE